MHAHKVKVTVPDSHQVVVRLPDDFPPGEAEITVGARAPEVTVAEDDFVWFEAWRGSLPSAPTIPLEALDRAKLYR